ncbi:4Fe-4S single cluster domain-containing protein [Saccharopolyspora shandongensis]|uniref:4Fe-4S single cluster domain-containing protein n=1 Tax=Saccharopolyspora shandongensis TaxID=418495 RepID=A0A1H3G2X1_9PSEU|nr:radical SAM protein [Saccharopolyspora shandongensis]SDX97367.1 4Fe-4S single cluster domain-containing protein [Saccharopolyspora shandongensis]
MIEQKGATILTRDELKIVHLVLNTDCNAWDRPNTPGSPGVCRFCYRERNRVFADPDTVRRVIDLIRHESAAQRIVFTGGDPLMPYDNHLEVALAHAVDRGFETNLHTNGLLLADRYSGLRQYVTLYSLAIDGPDATTADWFRGTGFFERFLSNVEMLVADQRRLAFNTFTTTESVRWLLQLGQQISNIAARTSVEYWLISQYRPIGRPNSRKSEIYGYDPATFVAAVDQVRGIVGNLEVFAQPTRAPDDPYPFRAWILADGTVTADLGSVAAPRNAVLGNMLSDGLEPLIRRAFALRDTQFPASNSNDHATPTEN